MPSRPSPPRAAAGLKPTPSSFDDNLDALFVRAQRDENMLGFSVPRAIGQSFLHNADKCTCVGNR